VDELKSPGKPFEISRRAVWEAWEKVRANKGAPGVDGESVADFEKDLKGNLYKIWNRMSSGTYFPPPVRAVEVAKAHGMGTRILGVPTVADRIAQTVVAGVLEERAGRLFHPDSYGYRPKRSALDAVAACRRRCWETDWVIDLDIRKFFDSVPWDLVVKAVQANTDRPWVVLYVRRWLQAPLRLPDGTLRQRDRGTPQGGLCSAAHNPPVGYSLNRSCPAQRVGLGRSDLAELNQRPGPMTFSYRSCSTYVNSPEAGYVQLHIIRPGVFRSVSLPCLRGR
jgi:RNA-directed DNA polymerase